MRLLEWGLLLREGGVWSDTFSTTINTFCVRIYYGDGSGQFIPPKGFFSSWGKVWAYRLTRGLFQTALFENKILIPKRSQSCSWRSRSPISTHVWRSKCGKHTHLLRIKETLPTFINHLVGISLLKVGQKSKPMKGRLSRKVSARGIERVRCISINKV